MLGRNISSKRDGLPPESMRLRDGFDFVTVPTDEYGRIQVVPYLRAVRATLHPEYVSPIGPDSSNDHHLYHSKSKFLKNSKKDDIPKRFRELPLNIIILPIPFHNWLHRVSKDFEIPDHTMMEYTIEGHEILTDIFQAVLTTRKMRKMQRQQAQIAAGELEAPRHYKPIEESVIEEVIETHQDQVNRAVDAMARIPEPFRLVDPDKPLDRIVYEVGRLAAPDGRTYVRTARLEVPNLQILA